MTSKSFYYCKGCKKVIGWKFGSSPPDEAFCFACEPFETHKEEARQKDYEVYRHALNR